MKIANRLNRISVSSSLVGVAIAAILLAGPGVPLADAVEVESSGISDDIGPDGLKRRGDGSLDDTQPGRAASGENRVVVERSDVRTRDEDGTRTRERSRTTLHPVSGEVRRRTESRVRNADGSETRTRSETRTAADGTVLRERTRLKEKAAHADRSERSERGERADRSDRAERAERSDRADRAERPERAERPDRAERAERD